MKETYERFLNGELALEEAASLLKERANLGRADAGTLDLSSAPERQREKAAELLNEVIRPVWSAFERGELAPEAAARQLAPFLRPLGVWALNANVPVGPDAPAIAARFAELFRKLADVVE